MCRKLDDERERDGDRYKVSEWERERESQKKSQKIVLSRMSEVWRQIETKYTQNSAFCASFLKIDFRILWLYHRIGFCKLLNYLHYVACTPKIYVLGFTKQAKATLSPSLSTIEW
jgi:hypothetical protein